MNKKEIIEKFAKDNNTTKKDATTYVDSVIEIIKNGVVEDGEVDIFGFMKISKVHKEARMARNVKTGEPVEVAAKDVPKCTFKKAFKDAVNA